MKIILYSKYRNLSLTAKAALWFVVCSLLQKAAAFITVPVFTRLMSTEQYGIYSIYLAWTNIMAVVLTLNMENGAFINEYAKTDDIKQKTEAPLTIISLALLLTLVATVVYFCFHDNIASYIGLSHLLVVLMLVEIMFSPAYKVWMVTQRFLYKYKRLVGVTLSLTFIQVVGGIILVYCSDNNHQAIGRVMATVIPHVIVGLILIYYFAKKAHKFFSIMHWRNILKLQLPLVAYNLSMVALLSSDKIMINILVGVSAAGIYSIAYSIGQILTILKSSVIDAYHPWIYEKLKNKEYLSIGSIVRPLIFFFGMIAVLVSLLAKEVVAILAPSSYYDAVPIIPAIASSALFTLLNQIFVIIDTYYEKTRYTMYASIFASLLNILLNYLTIPIWGYKIAGATTLVSYMALAYANYFYVRRIVNVKDSFSKIDIFILPIILAAFISSISFLYDYTILMHILLLVFLLFAFVNRRKLRLAIRRKL